MAEGPPKADFSAYINREPLKKEPLSLTNRAAFIGGGTRTNGIGAIIGEHLALNGASPIILTGTEASRDEATAVASRLRGYGVLVHTMAGNTASQAECERIMQEAYKLTQREGFPNGNVDILINCVGTNRSMNLLDVTEDDATYGMVKFYSTLFLTQQWKMLRDDFGIEGGRVVNIGSVIGTYGNFGQEVYSAANGAQQSLTRTMSFTMGGKGVTVNYIDVGFVPGTEMSKDVPESFLRAIESVSAIDQLVDPHNLAELVVYLVGPYGGNITGETIRIDNGAQSNYIAALQMLRRGYRELSQEAKRVYDQQPFSDTEVRAIEKRRAVQNKRRTQQEGTGA